MNFLCFKKCPHNSFPPNPPMDLQNTYINGKLLASALFYRYGASKAGQDWQSF